MIVMAGLVPAIHDSGNTVKALAWFGSNADVDGRDKPGHDDEMDIEAYEAGRTRSTRPSLSSVRR
jgi:hypothetical protein